MKQRESIESGSVYVELLLVLPILLFMLAAGFEVSRTIHYKNAAIQLSFQTANSVFRECTSEKAILMSDCVTRIQREMTEFARTAYPNYDNNGQLGTSHVAVTVYFNHDHNRARMGEAGNTIPDHQYTARADHNQFPGEFFNFDAAKKAINIDVWNDVVAASGNNADNNSNAGQLLANTDFVVVAQAYIRYHPIGLLFGARIFNDDFITDFTIL